MARLLTIGDLDLSSVDDLGNVEAGEWNALTPAWDPVVATFAHREGRPVAGSLLLRRNGALYGRYWGCLEHLDHLHFELCYYLPIEWAIENRVERFEAGAQGEHKLKRGLLPAACWSAHWLRVPELHEAVGRFLRRESRAVASEMAYLQAHSPFRNPAATENGRS